MTDPKASVNPDKDRKPELAPDETVMASAERLGVDRKMVERWRSGQGLSMKNLVKIALAYERHEEAFESQLQLMLAAGATREQLGQLRELGQTASQQQRLQRSNPKMNAEERYRRALALLCKVALNLNETVYVD